MRYDFDQIIERRGTDSIKWATYPDDVIPLWVADMDFVSPQPVIDALRSRVEHGVFGYGFEPAELRSVLCDHFQRLYHWKVEPQDLIFLPGVVPGLNLVCRAIGSPGDEVLIQTPIYPPFLTAPANSGRTALLVPLTYHRKGYEIDFDAFEATITPRTKLFLFCNPHNPSGRVFSRGELEKLAEICVTHDLTICSDEIHKDFVFEGHQHLPIASLAPEIAERTITLFAPSKTYNIAGLQVAVAMTSNAKLRARLKAATEGVYDVPVGLMGYVAALAAYREGEEWLAQVLNYLQSNRDFVMLYVREQLPGIGVAKPEGTYLAWLDCREAGIEGDAAKFFLKKAKVALSKGSLFGAAGEGFVRLNFGCPRRTLEEALDRMSKALVDLGTSSSAP